MGRGAFSLCAGRGGIIPFFFVFHFFPETNGKDGDTVCGDTVYVSTVGKPKKGDATKYMNNTVEFSRNKQFYFSLDNMRTNVVQKIFTTKDGWLVGWPGGKLNLSVVRLFCARLAYFSYCQPHVFVNLTFTRNLFFLVF